MLSDAEIWIIPPPEFFSRKSAGSPNAAADQSTTIFSISVWEGDIAYRKAGEWKAVANISAMKDVKVVVDGKYPKYLEDDHFIIPR